MTQNEILRRVPSDKYIEIPIRRKIDEKGFCSDGCRFDTGIGWFFTVIVTQTGIGRIVDIGFNNSAVATDVIGIDFLFGKRIVPLFTELRTELLRTTGDYRLFLPFLASVGYRRRCRPAVGNLPLGKLVDGLVLWRVYKRLVPQP